MSNPQTVLGSGEVHIWNGKPAYEAYVGQIIFACLLMLIGLIIQSNFFFGSEIALLVFFLPSIIIFIRVYFAVNSTLYYLTNMRIVKEYSFLSRRREETTLDQVTNVMFNQGLFQRLSNCGNVTLNTAGTGFPGLVIESVKDPVSVRRTIMNAINQVASLAFCTFCGTPLRQSTSYCPKCGRRQ